MHLQSRRCDQNIAHRFLGHASPTIRHPNQLGGKPDWFKPPSSLYSNLNFDWNIPMTYSPVPHSADPSDLHRMADEWACAQLITSYTHLVDFGNASAIADLFVPAGIWRNDEFAMEGQDAIRAGFARREGVTRRQSRHVCTNIAVNVDGDTATALCYLVNYRHDSTTGQAELPAPADVPKYVGEYHDQLVRTDQGWRFVDRYCTISFLRPSKH